jgi:hypothetical protein
VIAGPRLIVLVNKLQVTLACALLIKVTKNGAVMSGKNKSYSTLNSMLAGIEGLFLAVVIGLVFPILLGLAGWWVSIPFAPESSIFYYALGGFLLGVLVDMIFLRSWTRNALRMPLIWPVLVYLFYSAGLFGFFMGVPAFNVVLGLVGGYYMGMRLRANNAQKEETDRTTHRTGLFTASVLGLACAVSWLIAFQDAFLEANISGMFALAEPISKSTILALAAAAGMGLIVLEYTITRAAVKFARFGS